MWGGDVETVGGEGDVEAVCVCDITFVCGEVTLRLWGGGGEVEAVGGGGGEVEAVWGGDVEAVGGWG